LPLDGRWRNDSFDCGVSLHLLTTWIQPKEEKKLYRLRATRRVPPIPGVAGDTTGSIPLSRGSFAHHRCAQPCGAHPATACTRCYPGWPTGPSVTAGSCRRSHRSLNDQAVPGVNRRLEFMLGATIERPWPVITCLEGGCQTAQQAGTLPRHCADTSTPARERNAP